MTIFSIVHTELSLGQAVVVFGSILPWRDQTLFSFLLWRNISDSGKTDLYENSPRSDKTCFFSHTLISLKQE